MDYVSSPSPSDSSADEDVDCLMKAGFWYQQKPEKVSLSFLKNNVNNFLQGKYKNISEKVKHKIRESK